MEKSFSYEKSEYFELVNQIYDDIKPLIRGYSLHHMPAYIGFTKDGKTVNITVFRILKDCLSIEVRLPYPDYNPLSLNGKGLKVVPLCRHWYSMRITSYDEYKKYKSIINELIVKSEKERTSPKRIPRKA